MLQCIVVDDESHSLRILDNYIERIPFLENKGSFLNPKKALAYVNNNDIDLVYLDINMPHLSGFDFIELLTTKAKVILTTAYSEYAMDGYKYDVLDYLTKPIPFDVFLKASERAQQKNRETVPSDYIVVRAGRKGKFVKIHYRDILYIESQKNYAIIHTVHKEQEMAYLSMIELEEKLPKDKFFRTHKSFIIAFDQFKYVDGGEIVMYHSDFKIPLSRFYRDDLFELLESKMVGS